MIVKTNIEMPFFIIHVKKHCPISFSVHMSMCLWQNTESVMLHSFPTALRSTENTSVAQTIKNDHVNVDMSYLFRE